VRRAVAPATLALLVAYEAGVGLWIYYDFREAHAGALGVALWAATELAGLVLGAYGGAWRFLLAPLPAPLLAVPAGDYQGGELPVWLLVPLALPALALPIAVGVVAGKRMRRRRAAHVNATQSG
jgi:hypothetical protein